MLILFSFELWHGPFETAMERHEVLMALRATASPDEDFQRRLQRQSRLVRSLLQKDPKKRPTAAQILDGGSSVCEEFIWSLFTELL
jgi:serine/threonine protein kinase